MTIKDKNIECVLSYEDDHEFGWLVGAVCEWAVARNITAEGGATALTQLRKMKEEVQEFEDATTEKERIDALGDIMVMLIQLHRLSGYDFVYTLTHAWNEIRDRKGTMIDGVFHKEV